MQQCMVTRLICMSAAILSKDNKDNKLDEFLKIILVETLVQRPYNKHLISALLKLKEDEGENS